MYYDTKEKLKAAVGKKFTYTGKNENYLTNGRSYEVAYWELDYGVPYLYITDNDGHRVDILLDYGSLRTYWEPYREPEIDLTKLDKPLKDYPKEVQLKVFEAWLDDDVCVKYTSYSRNGDPIITWLPTNGLFHNESTYRVIPEKSPEQLKLEEVISKLEKDLEEAKEGLSKC